MKVTLLQIDETPPVNEQLGASLDRLALSGRPIPNVREDLLRTGSSS